MRVNLDGARTRAALAGVALLVAAQLPLVSRVVRVEAAGYSSTVLADSPSVYYRLDQASGPNALDSSPNAVTGTYQTGVGFGVAGALSGDSDTAITAPGNAAAVLAPDGTLPSGNSPRTIEAWFKTAGSTGYLGIASYGVLANLHGLAFDIANNNAVFINFGNGNTTVGLPYSVGDNRWHEVALVVDGAGLVWIYLDGQVVGNATVAALATTPAGSNGLAIGQADGNFSGTLDEVAVYPSALSSAQLGVHWRAGVAAACLSAPTTGYAGAVAADSPVRYYRLGETSGRAALDSSGNCEDGAYNYDTPHVSGALVGDGDGAAGSPTPAGPMVTAPDDGLPTGSSPRTVEAWFKTPGSAGTQTIVSYGLVADLRGERLDLPDASHLVAQFGNGNVPFSLPYSVYDNRWHEVAMVYDSAGNVLCYLDGQVIGTVHFGSLATVSGYGLQVGVGGGVFTGAIDEVAVYPTGLSAAQVRTHWRAGVAATCPSAPTTGYAGAVAADSPARYYRLGETSGRAAMDASGQCRDAAYEYDATHLGGAIAGDSDGAAGAPTPSGPPMVTASDDGLPLGNSARTMEVWVNTNGATTRPDGQIAVVTYGNLSQLHGFELDLAPTSLIVQFGNGNTYFSLPYSVFDQRWHQVAVEVDGLGNDMGFVDGAQVGVVGGIPTLSTTSGYGMFVGAGSGGTSIPGRVDEVAVYPTALSPAEMVKHWRVGVAGRCLGLPTAGYAGVVAADSPARYYRLGEAAGRSADDSSGNCRDGAYDVAAPRGVGGVTASDGDGAVSAPTPAAPMMLAPDDGLPLGNAARTMEAWVNTNGATTRADGQIAVATYGNLSQLHGFELDLAPTSLIVQFGNGNTYFPLPYGIFDQRWHQVAVEVDGLGHDTGFVDGAQIGSFGGIPTLSTTTGYDMLVGAGSGGSASPGRVDEVAIYPSALSPARISAHYQATRPTGGAPSDASERGGGDLCYKCLQRQLHHAVRVQPVDTANGNMFHTFTDFDIPGLGYSLLMSRTYNANAASIDSGLGYGWVHNNGATLVVNPVPIVVGSTATITEENGAQTVFTWNGTGWTALPRVIATLTRDGTTGTWTLVRDRTQTLTFNAAGQLATESDLNGETTTFGYVGGLLSTVTDSSGRTLTFAFTGSHLTSVTDFTGRQVRYQYNDGLGNLTDVFDVNNGHWVFGYDSAHHLTIMTDPAGKVVTTHYDAQGRADWQTDGNSQQTSFEYDGDSTTVTDPRGRATIYYYANGLKVAETRGAGTADAATWHYAYDPDTLALTEVVDPNGNTTQYTYDSQANMLSRTDPLGRTTVYSNYNAFNEPQSVQDGNGVVTTLSYDTRGNLHQRSTPLVGTSQVQVTVYNHDDPVHHGELTSMIDPDGKTWLYGYDGHGYLSSTTDPLGDRSSSTYNSLGWVLSTTAPRENAPSCSCPGRYTTTYSYIDAGGATDEYGDVQKVTAPTASGVTHVTTTTYDADRNVHTVVDANGNPPTTSLYDGDNMLVEVDRPDGTSVKTTYWPDETVHQQIDGANHGTSYDYDAAGHLASVTDPLGRTTSYHSDGAGNLLTVTDPQQQVTTYVYDAANQRTAILYSDGVTPNVTGIQYDGDGQRLQMTDGTGTSQWTYDSLHRLTSYQNGAGATVTYGYTYGSPLTYDLKNQVRSLTYPDGHVATRGYDDAGRWTSVTDWLGHTTTFTPDEDSNITAEAYANGVNAAMSYDETDWLRSIGDTKGGSTLASFSYTPDHDNQVQSASTTGVPSPAADSYGYNSRNQLSQDSNPTLRPYAYDAADNPTRLDGTLQSFDAANQLSTGNSVALIGTTPAGKSTNTSASEHVALPGGTLPGDLIVVGSTQPTGISVSGVGNGSGQQSLSQVVNAPSSSVGGGHTTVLAKRAVAGDTEVDLTYSAISPRSIVVLVYRGPGDQYLDAVGAPNQPSTLQGNDVTAPSVPSVTAGDRLILFQGASATTSATQWSVPSDPTMTEEVAQATNLVGSAAADQVVLASGATPSETAHSTKAGNLDAVMVAVKAVTSYSFDPRGNRIGVTPPAGAGNAVTLTYDQANRLVGYGGTASYAYDGDGLRMSKTVNGVTSQFAYDVAGGLPLVLVGGSTEFVYGPGGRAVEQLTAQPAISPPGVGANSNGPTTTNRTLSVVLPSGIQANDQIVLAVSFPKGVANAVLSGPSGFAQLGTVTSAGTTPNVLVVYRKQANGSESGQNATITFNGLFASAAVAASYHGVDPITAVDVMATGSAAGSSTVGLSPAATTRYTADRWIVLQGATFLSTAAHDWTAPAGMQEQTHASPNNGTVSAGLADAAAGTPGSTGSLTSTLNGASGQLTTMFVALKTPPSILYLHQDQLGSTRLITDEAASVLGGSTFDAYGKVAAVSGTATTPLGFAGQYTDSESGFQYLRARYYDPGTAQFLTRDPLVTLTHDPYTYVGGKPLSNTDPTGLSAGVCGGVVDGTGCGDVGGLFEGIAGAVGAVVGGILGWIAGSPSDAPSVPIPQQNCGYGAASSPGGCVQVIPCPHQARPQDVDPNLRPRKSLDDALRLQRYFDSLGRTITPEDPGPVGPTGQCGRYCKALIAATIGGAAYLLSQGYTNTESPTDRPGGPQ